ncbi:MAG: AMP-binding protein, partial [Oscillospiraceae bacterium]
MNIYEEIRRKNADKQERPALSIRLKGGSERSYTFAQMFAAVSGYQQMLVAEGLCPGDRVAIISESCPEWTIVFLAIASVGATSLLMDASLGATDLMEQLEQSDVRCLFASPKSIEKLGNIPVPTFDLLAGSNAYLNERKPLRTATIPGNEMAASIIFSSGTTKKASGILHSHDSILNSALMCMESNHLNAKDRFLAILPNSHIYGVLCQIVGPLLLGAPTCFLDEMTSEALVGGFKEFKPSIFPAVPKIYELLKTQISFKINSDPTTKKLFATLFPICLKLRKATGINLGKKLFKTVHDNFGGQLRILCSAGAPTEAETAEFFYGIGFDFLITYGATETCIPTIGNYGRQISTDTCGKPYPNITVKISESGEILIKTPYRMLGYFENQEATVAAFNKDGWFCSGDLGCIDQKGLVRVLGRCKDNIVLATGKKIAPDDIEKAYMGIDGLKELVVCGIPVSD